MKEIASLLALMFALLSANAQHAFRGVVLEDSAFRSPVYQANITVKENGVPIARLLTYFDGSFTFNVLKGKSYEFTATVPGTKDVTIQVTTDKKGTPIPATANFIMKRDGLRLVGRVKDINNGMPIDKAVVVLKDVQTREETRFTTNIDGLYNLKLKYETNYRVSIDKRSPGIINRYEDTVFFVSTVGFNIPLDYELDIALRKAQQLTNRTEFTELPSKPASKPVIEVKADTAKQNPQPEGVSPVASETPKSNKLKENPKQAEPIAAKSEAKPSEPKPVKEKKQKKQKVVAEKSKPAEKKTQTAKAEKPKNEKPSKQKSVKEEKPETAKKEKEVATPQAAPPQVNVQAPKVERIEDKIVEKLEQKTLQQNRETTPPPPLSSPPPPTIYFAKNAAYITDYSKSKLTALVEKLKQQTDTKIKLNAHAGKDETNGEELCQKRLNALKTHLISSGIAAGRITTKSFATSAPANDCHISGGCAEQTLILNRRIEIIVE